MSFSLTFRSECSEVAEGELRLAAIAGRQELSRPYEYTLFVETETDGGLSTEAIEALLREPCSFSAGAESGAQEIHGVLRSIELMPMTEAVPVRYRLTLVPALWRLGLARGSRVFLEKSWPTIVSDVLTEHGVAHELRLGSADYPVREYTVQYQESDLAFVSRLMEHWGIFYYFEQLPDGEKMILGDSQSAFVALEAPSPVPYSVRAGFDERGSMSELGRTHEVRPARVRLEDYNWREPSVVPEGEASCDEATGHGTVRVYGEHFPTPADGARLARIRSEQLACERERYAGSTSVLSLAPGHRFELSGYPIGDLDQEYVVTSIEDRLYTDGATTGAAFGHRRRFTAIPYAIPYRPELRTPRPRIHGFVHAIVDGPTPGSAAPIDELGRYKLVFPFDLAPEEGGRASRWVRMAQSSTGDGYGMHLPLHIGCEVAVMHLGGDPDRPVIVGAVPNKNTISPVTQSEATKSRIKSKAGILLELEDDI